MTYATLTRVALAALAFGLPALSAQASNCKTVHAELIEMGATQGCNPGQASCFLGVVQGNHGLIGTTLFKADGSSPSVPTSPSSTPYSGPFEYRLDTGTLLMRETGITVPGVVTAHQRIVGATGAFEGATGDFFVYGTRANGVITTQIDGTLCLP